MTPRSLPLLAAVAILATACGGDGGTGPSEETLPGVWVASKIEFASTTSPSTKVDIVALGASGVLTVSENGTWTLMTTGAGCSWAFCGANLGGTWSATSDELTLHLTTGFAGEWQFGYDLAGDALTLSGAHSEFDLDGDDQDEEVTMTWAFARQTS